MRLAYRESSGVVRRRTVYTDGYGEETGPPPEHDLSYTGHVAKDVVFQQLDCHPVRGRWNETQRAFLASASDSEPLAFFDYIEDAALAVPVGCRPKLPRCLKVPTREHAAAAFQRPATGGRCQWQE